MVSAIDRWDAHDQISHLMYRYCECMDQADFAGVGALFERGVWRNNDDIGENLRGDEVTTWLVANVQVHGEALATRHCTTNVMIDVEDGGTTATARSYIFLFQVTDEFPLQPIFLGRYHDVFEKHGDRWYFSERRILPDGIGDLSRHTLGGVLPGQV